MKPGPKPKLEHEKAKTRTFTMKDQPFNYIKYMASEWGINRSRALIKMVNFYKVNAKEINK